MRELYQEAWERLKADREQYDEIERAATPVLVFGQWQTASVITAGLNPSEDEFRDKEKQLLEANQQRFLHWPSGGQLSEELLDLAFQRSEGYFTRGRAYTRWFDRYTPFLQGMGVSFKDGSACHTDYLSPFATRTGISACRTDTQGHLRSFGLQFWKRVVETIPHGKLMVGHGSGYHDMCWLLNLQWEGLQTPYDTKGGKTSLKKPYLLFGHALLASGKPIACYWWKPNRNGSPLEWLNDREKQELGSFIREHAYLQGFSIA